jgi:pimeloyl-ACP methyl ester carboxylesterase
MATFVLIHGAGDVGWHWHLLQPELSAGGHDSVAPDLPCDDPSATRADDAQVVGEAVGDRTDVIVVGRSYGAFTAPLVAGRLRAAGVVLLAERLGITPDEVPGGHCVALSRPKELAELLAGYA